MKDVRTNLTANEKIAQQIVGMEKDSVSFHMNEGNIHDIIAKEKANKLDQTIGDYADRLSEHTQALREATEKLQGYDITKLEIKPTFSRILITLFDKNPFQRMQTSKSGLIIDTGGLAPTYRNTDNGEIEEAKQQIVVGVVQEIGPDVKYVRPGDTIFLDVDSARPVPFFKQGLYCLGEQQIIAVVNESLEARFNDIKNEH